MKRHFSLMLAVAVLLMAAVTIAGCSTSSPGMPEVPDMPSGEDTEIAGDWAGSWVSYTASDKYGTIDPLTFEVIENADGSSELSGVMTTTGFEDYTKGTVTGTLSGSTVNFNVSFENGPTMVYTGTLSGSAINGTYKLFEGGEETDSGNFYLTKK